jgi:hypothetical protein
MQPNIKKRIFSEPRQPFGKASRLFPGAAPESYRPGGGQIGLFVDAAEIEMEAVGYLLLERGEPERFPHPCRYVDAGISDERGEKMFQPLCRYAGTAVTAGDHGVFCLPYRRVEHLRYRQAFQGYRAHGERGAGCVLRQPFVRAVGGAVVRNDPFRRTDRLAGYALPERFDIIPFVPQRRYQGAGDRRHQ